MLSYCPPARIFFYWLLSTSSSVARDEPDDELGLRLAPGVGGEVEVVAAVDLLHRLDVEGAVLRADEAVDLRLLDVRVFGVEGVAAVVGLEAHARLGDEEGALAVFAETAVVVVVDVEGRGPAALDGGAHRLLGRRDVLAVVERDGAEDGEG